MQRPAVDWERAARRAGSWVPAGPPTDLIGAAGVVAGLREGARVAPGHVAAVTGLEAAAAVAEQVPALVVDRPTWARAATQSFDALISSAIPGRPGIRGRLGAVSAGDQLGAALAVLGTRVLGQYDPYRGAPGRLFLVAPNILAMQRRLDVDPRDFAHWVCLHELTHAVQFAAAPWLTEHLRGLLASAISADDGDDGGGDGATDDPHPHPRRREDRGRASTAGTPRLLDSLLDPRQRAGVERAVAVMSLLEGHADVVMDAVGTTVVPSVRSIRRAFEQRRSAPRGLAALVGRVLGLQEKMRQYREGAAFTRAVIDEVGHPGLNLVWDGPEMLPSAGEIAAPRRWLERVHG